jgi:hypothetical protein
MVGAASPCGGEVFRDPTAPSVASALPDVIASTSAALRRLSALLNTFGGLICSRTAKSTAGRIRCPSAQLVDG